MQIQVMDGEDSGPGRGKRQESELREGIDQAPGGKWATARALAVAVAVVEVAAQVGTLVQTGVSNGARRKHDQNDLGDQGTQRGTHFNHHDFFVI